MTFEFAICENLIRIRWFTLANEVSSQRGTMTVCAFSPRFSVREADIWLWASSGLTPPYLWLHYTSLQYVWIMQVCKILLLLIYLTVSLRAFWVKGHFSLHFVWAVSSFYGSQSKCDHGMHKLTLHIKKLHWPPTLLYANSSPEYYWIWDSLQCTCMCISDFKKQQM